jgi:hypothetical protein
VDGQLARLPGWQQPLSIIEIAVANGTACEQKPQVLHDWLHAATPALAVLLGAGEAEACELAPPFPTNDLRRYHYPTEAELVSLFGAEALPFGSNELGSIVMLNVFHHIPRPWLFRQEAQRTLTIGGRIVMIEPANSVLGRFIYKNFHHEPFDETGEREIKPGNPLSNSNQALPYIYSGVSLTEHQQSIDKALPQRRTHPPVL